MTQMLDPEHKPHPAKEIGARAKGCLAVIVALAILGGGAYFVWDKASTFIASMEDVPDYTDPAGKANVTIIVPSGSTLTDIGTILQSKGVIRSTKAFDKAVKAEDSTPTVQTGSYLMRTQIPASRALQILLDPGKYRIRNQVTVPEGLRLSAQVAALVKGTKFSAAAYQKALANPKALGLPSYAKNNPEGVLFPDTYELTQGATATTVLRQMSARYASVAGQVDLNDRAKKMYYTPYQVLIVASIVEKEVSQERYRAKVARVLYNRLDNGMPLGLDSTVIYALNLKTTTTTSADRQTKSPYNTYIHEGLPPGPISAPGKAALEAAANPAKGDWLYFTTVNFDTGETKFANDAAGHQKNVDEFQSWCQSHTGRCT